MEQRQVTHDKTISVSFHKPGSKEGYGVSVSVSGVYRKPVLKNAKALLEEAQQVALDTYNTFFGGKAGAE